MSDMVLFEILAVFHVREDSYDSAARPYTLPHQSDCVSEKLGEGGLLRVSIPLLETRNSLTFA